jgi:hypothetical protein
MQQERTKLESRTVARTGKDKVRAGKLARHESKKAKGQKSKNCCLRGKDKVTDKGQLPGPKQKNSCQDRKGQIQQQALL